MTWISVKERLPDYNLDVLVYHLGSPNGFDIHEPGVFVARYNGDYWDCALSEGDIGDVTHWMPLPELPNE